MRTRRRLRSRATPTMARLISPVFPRVYLLLEDDGSHLLLEDGSKLILEG